MALVFATTAGTLEVMGAMHVAKTSDFLVIALVVVMKAWAFALVDVVLVVMACED